MSIRSKICRAVEIFCLCPNSTTALEEAEVDEDDATLITPKKAMFAAGLLDETQINRNLSDFHRHLHVFKNSVSRHRNPAFVRNDAKGTEHRAKQLFDLCRFQPSNVPLQVLNIPGLMNLAGFHSIPAPSINTDIASLGGSCKSGNVIKTLAQTDESAQKLKGIRNMDEVAASINKMMGCYPDDGTVVDFVSGRELQNQHDPRSVFQKRCVELGFARQATEEEKQRQGVDVIFLHQDRIVQLGKCCLSMDAADEVRHPQTVSNAAGLAVRGSSHFKTGDKCTILCSVTMADEVLPPLFILPASAQTTMLVHSSKLGEVKQVKSEARDGTEWLDDPTITFNASGGMNGDLCFNYCLNKLMDTYHDAEDVPGKRVLIKSGSFGKLSPECVAASRVKGFYFCPPDGADIGQEPDQLFGVFENDANHNSLTILKALSALEGVHDGENVLKLEHIGCCCFGGDLELPNGKVVSLLDAFSHAFSKKSLAGSWLKCEYCPAKLATLDNLVLHHKVVGSTLAVMDTDSDAEDSNTCSSEDDGSTFEENEHTFCSEEDNSSKSTVEDGVIVKDFSARANCTTYSSTEDDGTSYMDSDAEEDDSSSGSDSSVKCVYRSPRTEPTRMPDGSFKRPAGRAPKDYTWCSLTGRWKKPTDS